ncbi:hypothetical protein MRX96_008346 [Rhipicephalus microplus]
MRGARRNARCVGRDTSGMFARLDALFFIAFVSSCPAWPSWRPVRTTGALKIFTRDKDAPPQFRLQRGLRSAVLKAPRQWSVAPLCLECFRPFPNAAPVKF